MKKNNDPKEEFVVAVMTREQIASAINAELALEGYGPSVKPFASDDQRLTRKACRKFVQTMRSSKPVNLHVRAFLEEEFGYALHGEYRIKSAV